MVSARPSAAAFGLFACLTEVPLIPSFIRTFECMHIHILHANVRVKEQSKQWRTQKLVHTSIIQAQLCANSPDPKFLESAREDSGINISQPTSS